MKIENYIALGKELKIRYKNSNAVSYELLYEFMNELMMVKGQRHIVLFASFKNLIKEYNQKWISLCGKISVLNKEAFEIYLRFHPELFNGLKQIRMVK